MLRDPRLKSFSIFNENLIAVEIQRRKVVYDRPTIVGFSILDLSKVHMYEFYYEKLQKKIGPSHIAMGYCDTDGIIITITQVDPYNYIRNNPNEFDTSDYMINNIFGIIPQNRKVPGLFKDEGKGCPVSKYIALRPKAYAIEFQCENKLKLIKKLKSVSKNASKSLEFKDYVKVWREKSIMYAKMFRIYSSNHVLKTMMINKKSLSANDDKRYILEDDIHTLALGHRDIPQ